MPKSRRPKRPRHDRHHVAAPASPTLWLVVLVAALALLPYLNTLTAGFSLDDLPRIVDNPMVQGREPAGRLLTWVDRPEVYRPLTMLTFAANARMGTSAAGYHLVNVLLHVGVSVLVFWIASLVLCSPVGAGTAAALFAVHPVHTEAVSNVFGRSEVLAAFFVLLCLLALVRAGEVTPAGGTRLAWRVASLAAFAAGLLSKESAVAALALIAAVHLWISPERRVARTLRVLAPYVGVALAYLAWRRYLVGAFGMPAPPPFVDNPLAFVGWLPRLATALVVQADYLRLLTFPITLSSDYSFAQVPVVSSPWDARWIVAVLLFVVIALALVLGARRAPLTLVAAVFVWAPLAATANILVVVGTIEAERLLYLPSVGWCLLAGWLVTRPVWRQTHALGIAAVVVCLFVARTWVRNEDWRDETTAHAVAVRTAPASAKTHYNRARDLIAARRLDEAIVHLERSLAIYPEWVPPRANLGGVLALKGRLEDAATHLTIAVGGDPQSAIARINLAQIRLRQGRVDDALEQLEAARRIDPRSPVVARMLEAARGQRPTSTP
jgi:tetratricopeptide (TPR) repeat protein